MKRISEDTEYLIAIWIIALAVIIHGWAHFGHIIPDCGREAYYPTQILLGKVLYKDIFNIYGPFSYMLNALLFKVFSINLNVLYAAGCVCTYAIITLIYLISRRFLTDFLSAVIAIFTVMAGAMNYNLFNFIFPYSYAMLYGLVAFLASFWFLLKYAESNEKIKYFYLSSFFAGLCITSKYEFLPYLIVILFAAFKINKLSIKQHLFWILSLLSTPLICFSILFAQGLRLNDMISNLAVLKTMAQSKTLKYFYHTQGVYFDKKTIPFLFLSFIKALVPISIIFAAVKYARNFLRKELVLFSIFLMYYWVNPAIFAFLPILIIIFAILSFKDLKQNPSLTLLTMSAILISLKVLWGVATLNYGLFFISFLLIAALALVLNKFKSIDQFTIGIYILVIAVFLAVSNHALYQSKNEIVKTARGKIYVNKELSISTNALIDYIDKNTKNTDNIVILPEGLLINFLTDRKSDDFYNSLIPLYVESFGEDKIIQHFKKTKPEYIVFNNWETKDYYFNYICDNYATNFCNYIAQNYTREKVLDSGFRYLIYKKK